MKGGREKNIAERVIKIIDRVIEALDQVQKREAELKDAELKAKATSGTALKDDPKYKKYFKMLKKGVPRGAVEQKMSVDGLDPAILGSNQKQPDSNSMEVSGDPVHPWRSPMINPSMLLEKLQTQKKRGNFSTTPSRTAKKAKIHDSNSTSPPPFSLNGNQLTRVISNLRKTTNRINSPAPQPKDEPMALMDQIRLKTAKRRKDANQTAAEIPREIPEKKPTISKIVINNQDKFHIIGVNSINGKITKHMGVVQNINKEKYDVQIKGSDTVLDDILLENQLKEILEIDDIVIFQDKNSSINLGKVDTVNRPTKTIRVQIDDKKKTAWLSHDTRIKCDKDIKRGYKLMKKLDDIYYYGVPYNLLESCESLSDDDIVIDEEKTFSFLLPTKI